MGHQTVGYHHDSTMDIPGHASCLVYVVETETTGLHCGGEVGEGCDWSGGGFKGRRGEALMRTVWQAHVDFVQAGGVIEHGRAANVDEGICQCVTCSIPWRMERLEDR